MYTSTHVHGQMSVCARAHAQNQKSWNRYAKNGSRSRTKQRSQVPWGEKKKVFPAPFLINYEGRLISNAHSEISRKRDHVFKQTKVGSKV